MAGTPPSLEQSNEHADNAKVNNFCRYKTLKSAKKVQDEVPYERDEEEDEEEEGAEEDMAPTTSGQ